MSVSRACMLFGLPLLIFGLWLPVPTHAQADADPERSVRVGGEGSVTVPPDQATLRFGIVTGAEEPESARARNARASKRAMNAVRELGIDESKIRLETLQLQPRRERDPQTDTWKETGYEATRQVVVEVDSLEGVPTLVARVVQTGANRLESVNYSLKDRTSARNSALRKAARDARDKARLLAEALDAHVGPVRQIDEQNLSFRRPSPRVQMETAGAYGQDSEPEPDAYAAGEIGVDVQVQVVFDLQVQK